MNAEDHVRQSHAEDLCVDIPAPETSTRIDIDKLRRLAEDAATPAAAFLRAPTSRHPSAC